jgi:hypothetical protein
MMSSDLFVSTAVLALAQVGDLFCVDRHLLATAAAATAAAAAAPADILSAAYCTA